MVAKFYSGNYCLEKEHRGFYLILEDLSCQQYSMKTGPEGLNFKQINDALVKIAKFHSTSYAFTRKYPEKVKSWNLKSWCDKVTNDPGFIGFMESCFDSFIKDLETEENHLDLIKPVANLKTRWIEVYKGTVHK